MANSIFWDLIGRDMLTPVLNAGEKSTNAFATNVTALFAKLGAAIAATFTVKAIYDFGKASVEAAMESEDAWAKWSATQIAAGEAIRLTNEQLDALASELQNVTRFEDEAVVNAASLLSIYENLNSEAFERTIRLAADMASLFGTDLEGATRQLGRALDDPIQGLTQLRRAGVVLDQATKDLVKSLVEQGKTVEAQNVLFDVLEKKFDGVAEAMGETTSGRIEKLKNQFGELKEEIGRALIPALEAVLTAAENFAQGFTGGMNEGLEHAKGLNKELNEAEEHYKKLGEWAAYFMEIQRAMHGIPTKQPMFEGEVVEHIPSEQELEERDARAWEEAFNKMQQEEKARTDLERQQEESIAKSRMEREGIEERAQEEDRRKDTEATEQRRIDDMIAGFAGAGRIRPGEKTETAEGFEASFEGLTDLNRRISQAAASEEPEEKVVEAVVDQGTKMVEAIDMNKKVSEQILEEQKKLTDPLREPVETGLA